MKTKRFPLILATAAAACLLTSPSPASAQASSQDSFVTQRDSLRGLHNIDVTLGSSSGETEGAIMSQVKFEDKVSENIDQQLRSAKVLNTSKTSLPGDSNLHIYIAEYGGRLTSKDRSTGFSVTLWLSQSVHLVRESASTLEAVTYYPTVEVVVGGIDHLGDVVDEVASSVEAFLRDYAVANGLAPETIQRPSFPTTNLNQEVVQVVTDNLNKRLAHHRALQVYSSHRYGIMSELLPVTAIVDQDGIATLTGSVKDAELKQLAGEIAMVTTGVTAIQNNVHLINGARSQAKPPHILNKAR